MDYGHPVRRSGRLAGKRVRVWKPRKARLHKRRRVVPGMKKRRRVGVRRGQPYKRRKTSVDDGVQYTQQKTVRFNKGKKLSSRSLIDRTVMAGSGTVQYAFRNYVNGNTGAFLGNNLGQWIDSGITPVRRFLPLYVFSLDNIAPDGAFPSNYFPSCRRAYMDTTGALDGVVQWVDIVGGLANGSTSVYPYRISDADPVQTNASKLMLEWMDIKMNIMGARTNPTRVDVNIVEVQDEDYDPFVFDAARPATYVSDENAYWSWYISRYTCNEIHSRVSPRLRKQPFKTLMFKSFRFQPTSTTESDVRGHIITPKIFWRPNRMCDYSSAGVQAVPLDDALISTNQTSANVGPARSSRPVRKQLLMIVGAMAPLVGVGGNAATDASFEWNIRTAYRKMNGLGLA